MNCRAKFHVTAVTEFGNGNGGKSEGREIRMSAVYDANRSAEDKAFSQYTPNGDLKFSLNNPALDGEFKPGDIYYLDFVKAEPTK